jgi:hypothetical protein
LTRKRAIVLLAISTAVLGAFLLQIDPATKADGNPNIVDFEFAWDEEGAAEIRTDWGDEGRDAARLSLWVDFAYLLSYGALLVLASAATRDLAVRRGWRRMIALGAAAVPAGGAGAMFDAIEDVWLLIALAGNGGDLGPALAAICATLKFALTGFAILYILAGLILRLARRTPAAAPLGVLIVALALAACGGDDGDSGTGESGGTTLPTGSDRVSLDPAEFTTEITNRYWPMTPGSRWVYREADKDTEQRVVVTVTDRTKEIANGVTARVIHDVVTEDGEPVEVTDDWYAQDADGNVWYLGEATTEYENGKPASTEGSFEAGVDGAEAGIIMPADPQPGLEYRQEYYEGEAEDFARVLALDQRVTVPFGSFDGVLQTEDTNPLEDPPQVEHKFFAPGVGPVKVLGISGGGGKEELLSYTPG